MYRSRSTFIARGAFAVLVAAAALAGAPRQVVAADAPSWLGPVTTPAPDPFGVANGEGFEPRLRTYSDWTGIYVGGQVAYSAFEADFRKGTGDLVAHALRETALENEQHPSSWEVLGKGSKKGAGAGAFVGFNAQWDDAIVGLELTYMRTSLHASASNSPIRRAVSAGGNAYVVSLTGTGDVTFKDIGALRGRAGYAFGSFMPYATVGLALARADVARSVSIALTENGTPINFFESQNKTDAYVYGFELGAGMEVQLTRNVFLRGDYAFYDFPKVDGVIVHMHTVSAGVGFRF